MNRSLTLVAIFGTLLLTLSGCGGSSSATGAGAVNTVSYGPVTASLTTAAPAPVISASRGATVIGIGGASFSQIRQVSSGAVVTPPVGNRIVYSRAGEIFSMAPDGSNILPLTSLGQQATEPSYNKEATKIAFRTDQGIYVMNADGTNVSLIFNGANSFHPRFSPDSTKLVFTSAGNSSTYSLYTINIDGTNLVNVTGAGQTSEVDPDWSSTNKLAFSKLIGSYYQIATRNLDGTGFQVLTSSTVNSGDPSWSPDGLKIAFDQAYSGIWTMSATGSSQTQLSTALYQYANHPTWSGDGQKIVFSANKNASLTDYDLYIMNANGSGVTDVTPLSYTSDITPYWSRLASSSTGGGTATTQYYIGGTPFFGMYSCAGFLFSQIDSSVPSVLVYDTTDYTTAGRVASQIQAVTSTETNAQNLIFEIDAAKATTTASGTLNLIRFTNGGGAYVNINVGTASALVTFSANSGFVTTVLPFGATRSPRKPTTSTDGRYVTVYGPFDKMYDGTGTEVAKGALNEVTIDTKSGLVTSTR